MTQDALGWSAKRHPAGQRFRSLIFRSMTEVGCSPAAAFELYLHVENWPHWLASVTAVERLDPGPLRIGAQTRVQQPRLPANVWTVSGLVPGESFSWEARRTGIRVVGRHLVKPSSGGCLAIAELEQHGPLAPAVVALTANLTRRYLQMETEGLRDRFLKLDA